MWRDENCDDVCEEERERGGGRGREEE